MLHRAHAQAKQLLQHDLVFAENNLSHEYPPSYEFIETLSFTQFAFQAIQSSKMQSSHGIGTFANDDANSFGVIAHHNPGSENQTLFFGKEVKYFCKVFLLLQWIKLQNTKIFGGIKRLK